MTQSWLSGVCEGSRALETAGGRLSLGGLFDLRGWWDFEGLPRPALEYEVGEGVVGWTARENKPLFLANAQADQRFAVKWEHDRDIAAVMNLPLIDDNAVVGVLQVQEQDQVMMISQEGKVNRFRVREISVIGRATQGVRPRGLEASDLVVSVTESLREKLRQRYHSEPADKFPLLPNGFDPAIQPAMAPRTQRTGKINVTYMGTLYGQTSARYYLDALDALPDEIRSSFTTHFIGRIAAEELATQQNRRSEVTVHGFLPQAEGLRRLADADLLLVNMTDPVCHTGKIFEYLAAGNRDSGGLFRDAVIIKHLRMHVAVAGMGHIDDAQAVPGANLGDPTQDVR